MAKRCEKRKRKRELSGLENQVYEESILDQYVMLPHKNTLMKELIIRHSWNFKLDMT